VGEREGVGLADVEGVCTVGGRSGGEGESAVGGVGGGDRRGEDWVREGWIEESWEEDVLDSGSAE
jgi:hypothetical protein